MCYTGICARNTIYLQPKNGGNIRLRRCCRTTKPKFSGTSKSKPTNIWRTTYQTSLWLKKKQVWLVDVAISGDSRIQQKEVEKITKYQDLKIEIERLWERKAMVVPVVIGALGAIPRDLTKHLNTLGLDKITPSQLQKAALLGTAHILRKYL